MSQIENYNVGNVTIERTPWSYTITTADHMELNGEWVRLHSALEVKSPPIKVPSISAVQMYNMATQAGLGLAETDMPLKLPLTDNAKTRVTWSSATSAGMHYIQLLSLIKDIDNRIDERKRTGDAILEALEHCIVQENLQDSPIVTHLLKLVKTTKEVRADVVLEQALRDLAGISEHEDVTQEVVLTALTRPIAQADAIYLEVAGNKGTQLHEILETALRYCIEQQLELTWPDAYLAEVYADLPPIYLDRAREGFILLRDTFGLTPKNIVGMECLLLDAEHRVAGTTDLLLDVDGSLVIVDWKSNGYMTEKITEQLAGYRIATHIVTENGVYVVNHPAHERELFATERDKELVEAAHSGNWKEISVIMESWGMLLANMPEDRDRVTIAGKELLLADTAWAIQLPRVGMGEELTEVNLWRCDVGLVQQNRIREVFAINRRIKELDAVVKGTIKVVNDASVMSMDALLDPSTPIPGKREIKQIRAERAKQELHEVNSSVLAGETNQIETEQIEHSLDSTLLNDTDTQPDSRTVTNRRSTTQRPAAQRRTGMRRGRTSQPPIAEPQLESNVPKQPHERSVATSNQVGRALSNRKASRAHNTGQSSRDERLDKVLKSYVAFGLKCENPSPEDVQAFKVYIAEHPGVEKTVLVDRWAQEYKKEAIQQSQNNRAIVI